MNGIPGAEGAIDGRYTSAGIHDDTRDERQAPHPKPQPVTIDDEDDGVKHSGHLGMAVKLAEQFGGRLLYVHGHRLAPLGWQALGQR